MTEGIATASHYERKLPPVAELLVGSMALVIVSGIFLASHLPKRASLLPVTILLIASGVLVLAAVVAVARLQAFSWRSFFQVWRWAMLAYLVIGGILEFVFLYDHTRGSMLVVFTLSLLIFAVDVPLLLAFSVARYQDPAS